MYLAVEIGTVDLNPVLKGAVATILYFAVGMAVLLVGFYAVDLLTPGKLRQLVFIDRRPNAVVVAGAMYIALTVVIITAIANSYSQLGQGLVGVAVSGLMGVILLGVALLAMHLLIPGSFHEHVEEPQLHPGSFAVALILLAVGGVTAAAVS
ncbi:membrane protein [Mycobacterium avium subsp. avium 10-9275]|nr:membrane protein [Mycobacterium avium subsp. avium 10-9275]